MENSVNFQQHANPQKSLMKRKRVTENVIGELAIRNQFMLISFDDLRPIEQTGKIRIITWNILNLENNYSSQATILVISQSVSDHRHLKTV